MRVGVGFMQGRPQVLRVEGVGEEKTPSRRSEKCVLRIVLRIRVYRVYPKPKVPDFLIIACAPLHVRSFARGRIGACVVRGKWEAMQTGRNRYESPLKP